MDRISLELKIAHGDALQLTIQDISEECIELNRKLFNGAGAEAEFIVGDLFESKLTGRFDIVMNSGLLEHFDQHEQEQLLAIFLKSLKPGGVYVTLVPNQGARMFNFVHSKSVERGSWPFGPERPLKTLSGLRCPGLVLEDEVQVGALDQFALIGLSYPVIGQFMRPVLSLGRRMPLSVDRALVKLMGGYCLLDRFSCRG